MNDELERYMRESGPDNTVLWLLWAGTMISLYYWTVARIKSKKSSRTTLDGDELA